MFCFGFAELAGMFYDIQELALAGTAAVVRINAPGQSVANWHTHAGGLADPQNASTSRAGREGEQAWLRSAVCGLGKLQLDRP